MSREDERWHCVVEAQGQEQTLGASLVVAADGANSFVREQL
ncbi:MAG: hypothetical protein F6K47_08840, partial [Symploca sp. SIO2E6]|nr:hypothetical protein [Symploca sp. SIO2E6]